jgi:dsDNA-specific endonuclease/ATPase MutS2
MSRSILHLDLHPIAKNSRAIDAALDELCSEAVQKRVKAVEIITGKGSGQLMKRVKKFLDRKEVKVLYKRVEVDANNHGRLFVYFR